jgi:hypothetical protein
MSADGTKYEGDFAEGKKHGYGVYTFADGSVYQVFLDVANSCNATTKFRVNV